MHNGNYTTVHAPLYGERALHILPIVLRVPVPTQNATLDSENLQGHCNGGLRRAVLSWKDGLIGYRNPHVALMKWRPLQQLALHGMGNRRSTYFKSLRVHQPPARRLVRDEVVLYGRHEHRRRPSDACEVGTAILRGLPMCFTIILELRDPDDILWGLSVGSSQDLALLELRVISSWVFTCEAFFVTFLKPDKEVLFLPGAGEGKHGVVLA